ncbi:MAG: SAM-dependent methyltransferase [Magnetococcales bacterium]|nr:SAM-dependent methyltransferase [Magnetococcales bacterium]
MKTVLKQLIKDSDSSSIPFIKFMEEALYNPHKGYYMTAGKRLGPGGDFVTAPELTSLFGELLALQMIELWQFMGSPTKFKLIEMGPGSGRLAYDILRTAKQFKNFYAAISCELVEISQDFVQRQKKLLKKGGVHKKVCWHSDIDGALDGGVIGVIFANEFLDALPVHLVEQTANGLGEVGVKLDADGNFVTEILPLSKNIHGDYFSSRGITLATGTRTEIAMPAQNWIKKAGELLQEGMVLLIDYGHTQKDYYAPVRTNGTLAGHLQHVRIDDPLANPGEMDLTAHVDFSAILAAGREADLELLGYTTQGWFLMGLGILERLEILSKVAGTDTGPLKEAIKRLIMPEGMGETFKVMALGKGIGNQQLSGFRLNEQSKRL